MITVIYHFLSLCMFRIVLNACCIFVFFQVIWSCWRANWKKRTWSCQTTWPPGRVEASRPQQTTRPPGRVPPWESLDHFTRPPGRVSSPPHLTITRSHHSTKKSSITITITRLHTRWPASESSPFHTQPDTRAQGRKEDSSLSLHYSLDHLGRVPFLIRPNIASFWVLGFQKYFAIRSMYFTFSLT